MRSFFTFHTRTAFAACLLLGGGPAAKRGSTSPVFGSNRTRVFGLTPDSLWSSFQLDRPYMPPPAIAGESNEQEYCVVTMELEFAAPYAVLDRKPRDIRIAANRAMFPPCYSFGGKFHFRDGAICDVGYKGPSLTASRRSWSRQWTTPSDISLRRARKTPARRTSTTP
jgi:hypothetical protein